MTDIITAVFVKNNKVPVELLGWINTFKYHVFAPMGRFQLELIYLYFPPSFHQIVVLSLMEGRWKIKVN